jgi:hypothetical protein
MNPAEEEDVVGEEERRSDGGGVEEAQAELHGGAHGDSRLGGCKPRFDGYELDLAHVMIHLVARSSNRW